MNDRKLTTGFYRPTESFKSIPEHIAVCFEDDLTIVAVVGASDDDTDHVLESHKYAQLFAAAPETLQKLSHALARIAELESERDNLANLLKQGADLVNEYAAEKARLTAVNDDLQAEAIRADNRRQAEREQYEKQIEAIIRAEYEYADKLAVDQLKAQAAEIEELKDANGLLAAIILKENQRSGVK